MTVLTLAQAKAYLRIDNDDDDANVQDLLDAAVRSASDRINRPIPWTDDADVEVEVPASVIAAIRLELRALYADPASVHSAAFESLLAPFIVDQAI